MKKIPPLRLTQYRTIEDLWFDTLRPWLAKATSQALTGTPCFLVLNKIAQAHWIRSRALQENLPLFGIKFLDAPLLQTELYQKFNLHQNILSREILEFLLQLEALKHATPFTKSIALHPTSYLDALEDLMKAGWDFSFSELPQFFTQWIQTLEQNKFWNASLDRLLLQKALSSDPQTYLAVIGWDAEFFPYLPLLQAACATSQNIEICIPMPRITENDPDVFWIKTLEEKFKTSCETCQDSGLNTKNSALAENLFLNQNHLTLTASPQLFSAKNATHQTQIILEQLNNILQKNDALTSPIGVVFSENTSSAFEVLEQLKKLSIPFHNEITTLSEPNLICQFQLACLDYLKNQCHIEKLISLIEILNDLNSPQWPTLDPVSIKKHFYFLFSSLPTTSAFLLAKKLSPEKNPRDAQLNKLVKILAPWPKNLNWTEARTKWNDILSHFQLSPSWEYYLPETIQLLIPETSFSTDYFFDFLKKLLASEKTRLHSPKTFSFSPLIITTLSQTINRTWSHLIFAECNESIWPLRLEEDPFLNDQKRNQWNQSRTPSHSYLLTTTSHYAIQTRQFLDTLENCENSITLITNQTHLSQPTHKQFPNQWFRQCYHLSPSSLMESIPKKPLKLALDSVKSLKHFIEVHQSRQNSNQPFDAYCFNLNPMNLESFSWDAPRLDQALLYPATFALKLIWQTESLANYTFQPAHYKTVNAWMHQWLHYVLQKISLSPQTWQKKDCLNQLTQLYQTFVEQLAQVLETQTKNLSLWWTTLLEKTHWASRKCLETLLQIAPAYTSYQLKMTSTLKTNLNSEEKLNLKNNCELILNQEKKGQIVARHFIHFKAGKFKNLNRTHLEQNQGIRYAAHLLQATPQNLESIAVSCITPLQGLIPLFTQDDLEKVQPVFRALAQLQRKAIFGIKGSLYHPNQKTENLPLATRPIPETVLKAKYRLTFPEQTLEKIEVNDTVESHD